MNFGKPLCIAVYSATLLLITSSASMQAQMKSAPANQAVADLINLSTVGIAGNGGDDTNVLQQGINLSAAMGKPLEVPASPVPYQVGPLTFPSNTTVIFDPGVTVQARPGFGTNDKLLNLYGVSNVHIQGNNTVFLMRKPEYTSGESRHCLDIEGSSGVTVSGISCNGSGGDGLYIGAGPVGYSSNISVSDSTFSDNRRQGMSIISAVNVTISRCNFSGTQGTAPSDGIDIEPNSPGDQLQNILIEDSTTTGNAGNGIAIDPRNLNASSAPVSIQILRNTSSRNVGSGYYVTNQNSGNNGGTGSITVLNSSSSFDGQYGAVASYYNAAGPAVYFQNLNVADPNQSKTTYDNSAISIKRGGGGEGLLGNVYFTNPSVTSTTGTVDHIFSFWDYSYIGFTRVQVQNPITPPSASYASGILQGEQLPTVSIQ